MAFACKHHENVSVFDLGEKFGASFCRVYWNFGKFLLCQLCSLSACLCTPFSALPTNCYRSEIRALQYPLQNIDFGVLKLLSN